jgi:hypothetical protein
MDMGIRVQGPIGLNPVEVDVQYDFNCSVIGLGLKLRVERIFSQD